MTRVCYDCSFLKYPLSLSLSYLRPSLLLSPPPPPPPPTDRQRPAFNYTDGLPDQPRAVTVSVVKCNKSGRLRGTRGEPAPRQPRRPSADKALLIQTDRGPSGGGFINVSIAHQPTTNHQHRPSPGDLQEIPRIGGTAWGGSSVNSNRAEG